MSHATFIGTRARLQRISDARFFSGWVKDFGPTEVRVRAAADFDLQSGDQFMIQLAGKGATAIFRGQLGFTSGRMLNFRITTPVRVVASTEAMRIAVDGMRGTISDDEDTVEVTVVDVSDSGAGIVCKAQPERGSTVRFEFNAPAGEVSGEAEVRYCRPDPETEGQFRVGLMIKLASRLDQAKWSRMLEVDDAA